MTKKDLEALRSKHKLARKAAYEDGSFSDFTYEVGYVDALDFLATSMSVRLMCRSPLPVTPRRINHEIRSANESFYLI